jgi:hypothetical protein
MAYTTINKSTDYFNTKLYSGNANAESSTTQSITGVGFQPDFTWIKERSSTSSHVLTDAVRGATKKLDSNTTNEEQTKPQQLQSFNSDGFTVGDDGATNRNGDTYASRNWKANGAGSSNTDGSITSTVSANTTSGFSIVSFTGTGSTATVGHGLGVKPDLIIAKNRTDAVDWYVYHSSLGATKNLRLNETYAQLTESAVWDNTEPTTSVISVNNANGTNGSSKNLIMYCFAEKKGHSKFGSYIGNGNADGTFVYTGFKPAFVIVKCSTTAADWELSDNKRTTSGGNVIDKEVRPNTSSAETGGTDGRYIDYLSNGFKLRQGFGNWNNSGDTYIYMAFAESPFVTSTGIPTTAR